MTDIEAVEREFHTFKNVLELAALAKEQREVINTQSQVIDDLRSQLADPGLYINVVCEGEDPLRQRIHELESLKSVQVNLSLRKRIAELEELQEQDAEQIRKVSDYFRERGQPEYKAAQAGDQL